ncbi:MAG TPA: 30S ribosomal protein S7 [bacterium]|nr:30S ribosomal protein S7 [bacterium]
MPRKAFISRREILPDAKFGEVLIQKFINKVMWDGEKSVAEKIVYSSLDKAAKGKDGGPVEVFRRALENVRPKVMVKSTRMGGANYQVPTEVTLEKSQSIGMKWIITAARGRSEKGMVERLAAEFDDAYNKRGNAYKKMDETHKMAEANKAFAHFKW